MTLDDGFLWNVSQDQLMIDNIHHIPAMEGPASILYHTVGPVGWVIVAVFILLSPTIFTRDIMPRLMPYLAPYVVLFYRFMDEFEEPEAQHPWIHTEEVDKWIRERIRRRRS